MEPAAAGEPPGGLPQSAALIEPDDLAEQDEPDELTEADYAADPDQLAEPDETAGNTMVLDLLTPGEVADRTPPPAPAVADPEALATMRACRDDGAASLWLGQVVRGQFVPLPPAVAGLAATSLLAWLGVRDLSGLLLLTPLVVMLLAAFGSTHPHAGRLDWLTPAVLLAGQLVYTAAVGFAFGVPPPVTFTLCALIALRYVELGTRDRRPSWQAPDTRLGWEGRMLVVGFGAMIGIATVAYAALAAYLIVLICARVAPGYLAAAAGARR